MDFNFSNWQSTDMNNHNLSDVVLGLSFGSIPDKPGINANLEMLFGLRGILNTFNKESFIKEPVIIEAELNVGYKFLILPVTISTGYGIWSYTKLDREYKSETILGTLTILETLHNWGHGATLKVLYSF